MKGNEVILTEIAASPAQQHTSGRPSRILVVDDEPLVRHLTLRVLSDAGYQVDGVAEGAAAWDVLQKKNFDLIITDNNMPKVSGLELIEKVHAAGMALPVIMATAAVP